MVTNGDRGQRAWRDATCALQAVTGPQFEDGAAEPLSAALTESLGRGCKVPATSSQAGGFHNDRAAIVDRENSKGDLEANGSVIIEAADL